MNMSQWRSSVLDSKIKKPMPVLSYPGIQKLGVTVRELIGDSSLMAECMASVAAEVNLLASVSFMDLSVEAECFGCEAIVTDYEVPAIGAPIVSSLEDAEGLRVPAVGYGRTGVCLDAIEKAKKLITDRPVFAGCIGPFSLAGRLIGVSEAMIYCYEEPEILEIVLQKCTEFITAYIKEFKRRGADGIILCEPLSGMVSPAHEEEFSAPYVKKIAQEVQDDSFMIVYHNCGNFTYRMTESISHNGCKAFHFGNAIDIKVMLDTFPDDSLVLGNISPSDMFVNGTPETMRAATEELMHRCGRYRNFIPSSGCDIPPKASWDNIMAFIGAANGYYLSNNQS
jgi:uroporphyrinogen decarboxylase